MAGVIPAAYRRRRRTACVLVVDLPLREPVQHLIEGDPSLEANQCRAEAVVRAVPEGHVLTDVAMDVKAIGGVESTFSVGEPGLERATSRECNAAAANDEAAVELGELFDGFPGVRVPDVAIFGWVSGEGIEDQAPATRRTSCSAPP